MNVGSKHFAVTEFKVARGTGVVQEDDSISHVMSRPYCSFNAHLGLHPADDKSVHTEILYVVSQSCSQEAVDIFLHKNSFPGNWFDQFMDLHPHSRFMLNVNDRI